MAVKLPYDFPLEPPLTDYTRRYFEEMIVLIQKHFELISGAVNNLSGEGGIGGGPHATTHYVTGDDPVDITKLAGYPGGTTTFLRDDGTWSAGVVGPEGPEGPPGPAGPEGPMPALLETFITLEGEPTLPNSVVLVAGDNVVLDGSVPGQIIVNASGEGGTGGGMNLDYLGQYPAAPVYYDGDIVIGPDNIAYMCVVDGTTTGPEPWPGVGMASAVGPPGPVGPAGPPGPAADVIVDATYWTVSPHETLTNERALNLLANGYVKSTAGVPSTVAVIPVVDGGTGATTATQARVNLGVGNVGTANYSGDANTYLRGDGVWAPIVHPQQIPQNLIAIFAMACPVGWARVTAWDGYFLRSAATYTGVANPANNHYHLADGGLTVPAHGHTASGLTMPYHSHGGWVVVAGSTTHNGDHSHSGTVQGETSDNTAGDMNVDAGGSGNMARGPHRHNVNLGFGTTSEGGHSHTLTNTGGVINSDGGQAIEGSVSTAPAATVAGNVGWATNTSYPAFFDVVYCYKL
jgi:hypothetical protein